MLNYIFLSATIFMNYSTIYLSGEIIKYNQSDSVSKPILKISNGIWYDYVSPGIQSREVLIFKNIESSKVKRIKSGKKIEKK